MDSRQAKEILMRSRPETTDAADAEFVEALEQARRDPELGRWFAQHRVFQNTIRDRLRQLPVPPGLKERILAGSSPVEITVWWRRPAFAALAATAAIVSLAAVVFFRPQPTEDRSFAAFRNRMVRSAQRSYAMDMATTNLSEIRAFLAAHKGHADYVLPARLERLPGDGCAVLRWHDRKISMVCFDLGGHDDLYLFVTDRSDFPGAPSTREPQFTRIEKLTAASWSAGGKAYVLAGPGDEQFLRGYLAPP